MKGRLWRPLLTNWLLVVLALVGLTLILVTQKSVTTEELSARERSLLKVFDEQLISRISMESAAERFSLTRDLTRPEEPGPFRLVSPVEELAKAEQVKALLSTLKFASVLRAIKQQEVPPGSLGLAEPRWVLHVDQGEVHYRLRLGGSAPSPANSSYLEVTGENVPGKGVFVVRDGLVQELTLKLTDFRSHELAAIGKDSLAKVQWQYDGKGFTLRNDNGRWRFSGMLGDYLADRDKVDGFFTQLARLKVEVFSDLGQAKAALGNDVLKLTLTPKKADLSPIEIELGAACAEHPEWLAALRNGAEVQAGCVSREIANDLRILPEPLLERHLFSLHSDEVEGFELIRGDAKLVLLRSETGFRMTSPQEAEVEKEIAEQYLNGWLALVGSPDPGDPKISSTSSTTLILRGVSDVPAPYREQRIDFQEPIGKMSTVVRRSVDGLNLQLRGFDSNQLDASGLLFRSRTVQDLQARQLTRIEVTSENLHQVITQAGSGPVLAEPQGLDPDGILMAELMDAVRSLRALRWVRASDNGEFGLSDPWLRVAFTVEPKLGAAAREEHLLRVGGNAKGGFFAQLDAGAIFVLGRRTAETMNTLVLDRAVFSPPLDPVQRIELHSARGELQLERTGQSFEQSGSSVLLSGSELEQLLSELRMLRPEAAVRQGPPLSSEGFAKPLLRVVARLPDGSAHVAWEIGAADTFRDVSIYFARVEGLPVTYAMARGPIQRILDVL